MITIDGSYGEGGGQILRTAIALSSVTRKAVTIINIRKNRPQPGLKPQHLTAVQTAASIAGAALSDIRPGSTRLTFEPEAIRGGYYSVDIGTAGSITLLLQSLLPAAIHSSGALTLDVSGGTDVAWSPPFDHMAHVLLPVLGAMGLDYSIQLCRRGYYPRGGGRVRLTVNPSRLGGQDIDLKPCEVKGLSHCSGLPQHVAQRQADSAAALLEQAGYPTSIEVSAANYPSTGSGITLWCGHLGGSALGKKGLPAEKVGKSAAVELIAELESGASVDVHLADQLIPYMGLAGSGSLTVRQITEHTRTNIWVVEQFLDVRFNVDIQRRLSRISL